MIGRRPLLTIAGLAIACGSRAGDTTDATAAESMASTTQATTHDETSSPDTTRGDISTTSDDAEASSTTGDEGEPPRAGPRYDQVRQKSSHNAFQRREAFIDQLVYHRIRSLELDIHNGKTFSPGLDGDWYVYHTDIVDADTSCVHLSDCLEELAIFHRAVPDHAVVTLWIDLKDDFASSHSPADLDALLQAHLGDAIATPESIVTACPNADDLRSAVADPRCGWPTLASLQGRFMVVLTGGDLNPSTRLDSYLQARGDGRLAFVAPGITDVADVDRAPHDAAVIINLNVSQSGWAEGISERGLVTRVWTLDDENAWTTSANAGAHHLATDMVNMHRDPWAVTHDETGWPFTCIDPCTAPGPEMAAILGFEVDSGDLWSTADDGWFLHDDLAGAPDGAWSAFVSTPNSHVETFAKGCLMARTDLEPSAAYLAVCRPADDERLRVQIRPFAGAQTTATEHDIVPSGTVAPETVAFVRLVIESAGTCATGFGSRDGATWVEIGSACFDTPLRWQGLAASSHDGGVVRFLFGNVRRDGGAPRTAGDFARATAFGTGSATVFDGVLP